MNRNNKEVIKEEEMENEKVKMVSCIVKIKLSEKEYEKLIDILKDTGKKIEILLNELLEDYIKEYNKINDKRYY